MILKLLKNQFINTANYFFITIAICLLYPLCINLVNFLFDISFFSFLNELNTIIIACACLYGIHNSIKISLDSAYGKYTYFYRQISCSNTKLVFTIYFSLTLNIILFIIIGQLAVKYDIFLTQITQTKTSIIEAFKTSFLNIHIGRYGLDLILSVITYLILVSSLMFIVSIRHSKFFNHRSNFFSYSILLPALFIVCFSLLIVCLAFLPGLLTYSITDNRISNLQITWYSIYNLADSESHNDLAASFPIVGFTVSTLIIYITEIMGIYFFSCKKFNVSE